MALMAGGGPEPRRHGAPVVLENVGVVAGETRILRDIDWTVRSGERWVVLGPNGAGKTTLLSVVTTALYPTTGTVQILGHVIGRTDVRELRKRIAVTSGSLTRILRPGLTAREIVATGRDAALVPWWLEHDDDLDREVDALLGAAGLTHAADRPFAALSEGERQRALLARMRLARAELWVFDEPAAGLDLGARERLVADLAALATSPNPPAIVFVTHHLEEIAPGFTHALVLRRGAVVEAGPIEETLTSSTLSDAFDLGLTVEHRAGRFTARAT